MCPRALYCNNQTYTYACIRMYVLVLSVQVNVHHFGHFPLSLIQQRQHLSTEPERTESGVTF